MARSITSPTASLEDCARLERFARANGVELEHLHPPPPGERHTLSTTLATSELRLLEAYARARGTSPAVILRGLVFGLLVAGQERPGGRQA